MSSILVFILLIAVTTAFAGGIQNRIANGEVARSKQIPYIARIDFVEFFAGRERKYICGGALISEKAILTSTNCFNKAISATVYLGTIDLRETEPNRIAIKVTAKNFLSYKTYVPGITVDNIGLIILPEIVKFNDAIKPVSIPRAEMELVNRVGMIAGYGDTEIPKSAPVLRYVVPRQIITHNFCEYKYREQYNKSVHICLDSTDWKHACNGDKGSPLVVTEPDGSEILVGLTADFSSICGGGAPVVYTRISSYLDWIHKYAGI